MTKNVKRNDNLKPTVGFEAKMSSYYNHTMASWLIAPSGHCSRVDNVFSCHHITDYDGGHIRPPVAVKCS